MRRPGALGGLVLAPIAAGALAWCCERTRGGAASPQELEAELAADPRLQQYLAPCARSEPFLLDTSDMLPRLVGRMARASSPETLLQAKLELAQAGGAAFPALQRFVEARLDDPARGLELQNALEVLGLMEEPLGRDLLRRALDHPLEGVCLAAVRGLERHATPREYDALLALAARAAPELQAAIAAALRRADRARLERDIAGALRASGLEALWTAAVTGLGACGAEAAARYADLDAPAEARPFLLACRALHGDAAALALLRADLAAPDALVRGRAAAALEGAGLAAELAPLESDADPTLRLYAVHALAGAGDGEGARARLERALGDASADVRLAALGALVARGAPGAADQALELLRGSRGELELGVRALERRWHDDPALAARAVDVLAALHAERAHRGADELALLEGALSRVPSADAAAFLVALAQGFPPRASGARSAMRDHRWFVLKAANTGPAGRRLLAERWAHEADALLRMDLIEGVAFERGDEAREFLQGVLLAPRASPYEKLLAAMRLARIGPAAEIAPLLKRATLAVDHAAVRRALHCLLWDWYGD